MRTIALTVAYDGTDWAGFQRQREYPSIQGALESALSEVLQHPVELVAAGRTDAGVHALGQVVSFRTGNPIPVGRIPWVTNRWLPESIKVREAAERPEGFHARHWARSRRYWYLIQPLGGPDPLRGRFCWQLGASVDVSAMAVALEAISGKHDFSALCHSGSPASTNIRTIQRAAVRRKRDYVVIDIQADAYLYQMVRLLVGNLVKIGRGEVPPVWLAELLRSKNRHLAGKGAPPCGLVLMRVGYSPLNKIAPIRECVGEMEDEELFS